MRDIILTSIFTLLLSSLALAQDDLVSPLVLRLAVKADVEKANCELKRLWLVGIVENNSERTVLVDKRVFWRSVSMSGPPKEEVSGGLTFPTNLAIRRTKLAIGDNFQEDVVPSTYVGKLRPGGRLKLSRKVDLSDGFFLVPGKYSIIAEYRQYVTKSEDGGYMFVGAIRSNEVTIEVPTKSNCLK